MALHGEIKVNGVGIGHWSAVRKEEVGNAGVDCYAYACEVDTYDSHRPPVEFEVVHWTNDGAAVLASKVLWQYGLMTRSN